MKHYLTPYFEDYLRILDLDWLYEMPSSTLPSDFALFETFSPFLGVLIMTYMVFFTKPKLRLLSDFHFGSDLYYAVNHSVGMRDQ